MEFLRCHVNVDVQISILSHPVVSKVTRDLFFFSFDLPLVSQQTAI